MRIVDAESELLKDFVEEVQVAATREHASLTVHVGRHPVLGKVVVVESRDGTGLIVEVDE